MESPSKPSLPKKRHVLTRREKWANITFPDDGQERKKASAYFFYGTLMDPSTLQSVLGLTHLPTLNPAKLCARKTKMNGPYPALVRAKAGNYVTGLIFEVPDTEDKAEIQARLEAYETDAYRLQPTSIWAEGDDELEDKPSWGSGSVFVWGKGARDECLEEGNFDLEAWKSANSSSI